MKKLPAKTRIINFLDMFSNAESWCANNGGNELADIIDYNELVAAAKSGDPVTVECEATDGYYDVTLATGHKVSGLSGYHLKGFNS
jgi:hypothetical protein